jgi:hypothetical protein
MLSETVSRTPGICLRMCAILAFHPTLHHLPKSFPSRELVQGFKLCQSIEVFKDYPDLENALVILMLHNITHNTPIIWAGDLHLLALVPQGRKYLNSFPLEMARRASASPNFLLNLYGTWDEFRGKEVLGFKLILLECCDSVPRVLSYLALFTNDELARIHSPSSLPRLLVDIQSIYARMLCEDTHFNSDIAQRMGRDACFGK